MDKIPEEKKIEVKMQDWKLIRHKRKLTLRYVEEKTGISNAYMSLLENGKIKNPSFSVIEKLSTFYFNYKENNSSPCCPNCMSKEIEDISVSRHNGVFGPGSANLLLLEIWKCKDCGVLFQPTKK